jgi:Zn-dependent M28 family amino/carboxypeptidase
MAARRPTPFLLAAAAAALLPAAAQAAAPMPQLATAEQLRDRATFGDDISSAWLSELTTRFGPRPAGSANERAAAEWSAARLKALGFENVEIQTFPITAWIRGPEKAELIAPIAQPLAAASLGESPPTPPGGLEAEVVSFPTLEDLMAVPDGSLAGKIVLVNRPMTRTTDGEGYGPISRIRTRGPIIAAHKGAVAFLLRSAGTDSHRLPHTGTTGYENGKAPIPAFALSVPDAEQMARLKALGETIRVRLVSNARYDASAHSQNVIAEIKGREHPEEVVLLGAHLDSWDLGTGAIDDGSGDAIVVAAAKLIKDLPQRPRRTIRVVLYGSEEIAQPNPPFGAFGGHAYLDARKATVPQHVIAGESDLGADRIYRLTLPKGSTASDFGQAAIRLMAPIKVLVRDGEAEGGEDVGPTIEAGAPAFDLNQDASAYFDIHHTADDTFDKVDKAQMDQNVAAWAGLVWLIADSDVDFRALEKAAK